MVDALQIQEIEDSSGYITNLAAPHAGAVASQARIAQAHTDQEATARELAVAAMKAQYERDTEIKGAGFLAETQEAKAKAAQAGPLAEAQASQQVIEQQTALVDAAARSIAGSNLTILNGTQGVSEMLAGLVAQGLAILEVLRKSAAVAADGTPPSSAGDGPATAPERAGMARHRLG